jgi:hypothetical protein
VVFNKNWAEYFSKIIARITDTQPDKKVIAISILGSGCKLSSLSQNHNHIRVGNIPESKAYTIVVMLIY